jgi:antitoxin FitA
MARPVVRSLEEDVKARLQQRARRHGRSNEAEVREILGTCVCDEAKAHRPLGKRLRVLFKKIGLEEEIPEWRGRRAKPADFS